MKKLIILLCIFATGCIGNATPYNPMDKRVERECVDGTIVYKTTSQPWWQADTATMKDSENPWLKFIPQRKRLDSSDPWNSYEQPAIFPEGFKPSKLTTKRREYLRLRRQLLILKIKRAERIRKAKEKLEKAKKKLRSIHI